MWAKNNRTNIIKELKTRFKSHLENISKIKNKREPHPGELLEVSLEEEFD